MFSSLFKIIVIVSITLSVAGCSQESSNQTTQTKAVSAAPTKSLQEAAFQGDLENVKAHIAAGTDLNAKDSFGSTALISASMFGRTAVAKELIAAGADLDVTNGDGSTALHAATLMCHTEIVQDLLAHGANRNIKNKTNATALDIVAAPYEAMKPVYQMLEKSLGPLGLQVDYAYLEATRPQVAQMLNAK